MTKLTFSSLSRRKLIASLAVGVAVLGAVAAPALNRTWFKKDGRGPRGWWNRQFTSLERSGFDEWSRQIGSEFQARTEGGTAALKLVAVNPLNSKGARPDDVTRDRAFVAVFDAGSANLPAGDRMYAVNSTSGDMNIFFGPANPKTAHIDAVFN